MNKKKDLVSVIMPSYNCGRYVEESIRSVQAQTYRNWEIIFVDDCSTDDTKSIVQKLMAEDERIKFLQNEKNSGAAVSRNYALRKAKGRWIAFLDSDDLWKPEKLEHQIRFMEENRFAFTFTEHDVIDEDSKPLNQYVTGPKSVTEKWMVRYCWIGCLTVLYDAQVVGLIQIADIKKNNDYAMWLKAISKTDCHLLKESLAHYRIRKGSITHNGMIKLIMSYYTLWRVGEKKKPLTATYYMVRNLFYGVIKKLLYMRSIE